MNRKKLLSLICTLPFWSIMYAQSWHPLATGITGDYGISAEAVYNGELYVGGWFYKAGGIEANNMARWSGWNWDSVGSGLTGGENNVDVMCVYNGKLYVGGAFFAAEGMSATNIASWNGTHWDTVGGGLTHCGSGAGWADAMAVYNGKLYVAGAFCHAGGIKADNIACWDGTKWDSLSSGINDSVYSLTVYNGNLYAGGQFTRAGNISVSNIAYWNGSNWNAVGTGTNNPVLAMATYKGDLYAGGEFTSAGGGSAKYIASWNGSAWSAVGAGIAGTAVEAFCVFNGSLYTGGVFTKSGAVATNNISTWNGTAWDTVGTDGINSTVDAFAVFDTAVFAGGEFTIAGSTAASDIAAWGGISLGVNNIEPEGANVLVYPNPNNGSFTITISRAELIAGQTMEVYNMMGEKIYDTPLRQVQGDNTINLKNQPAGIYLYRIFDQTKGIVNQGKIVIQ